MGLPGNVGSLWAIIELNMLLLRKMLKNSPYGRGVRLGKGESLTHDRGKIVEQNTMKSPRQFNNCMSK